LYVDSITEHNDSLQWLKFLNRIELSLLTNGRQQPRNLDDFAMESRRNLQIGHGIWQNFLQKTVGSMYAFTGCYESQTSQSGEFQTVALATENAQWPYVLRQCHAMESRWLLAELN